MGLIGSLSTQVCDFGKEQIYVRVSCLLYGLSMISVFDDGIVFNILFDQSYKFVYKHHIITTSS